MEFNTSIFCKLFENAFADAYNKFKDYNFISIKNKGEFISSNFLKNLSELLHNHFDKPLETHEWLYDICITNKSIIRSERQSDINDEIIFALECEWSSDIKEFALDFGKILCSKAKHRVFICGLPQKTSDGRRNHINKILKAIDPLNEKLENIILAFCPSPLKTGLNEYLWYDNTESIKDLINWILIFTYNKATSKLEEWQNTTN